LRQGQQFEKVVDPGVHEGLSIGSAGGRTLLGVRLQICVQISIAEILGSYNHTPVPPFSSRQPFQSP
jgi:hypothetical protein